MIQSNQLYLLAVVLGLNKKLNICFGIVVLSVCLSNCSYLLPFKVPKPETFNLYRNKTIGISEKSCVKTNGFYYFNSIDKKINVGKKYIGYYRFKSNGELHIIENIPRSSPDSAFVLLKTSIEKDTDKALYGYFKTQEDSVVMEYVQEIREHRQSVYFESFGVLSKNCDTLYVRDQITLRNGKRKIFDRICVFYSW